MFYRYVLATLLFVFFPVGSLLADAPVVQGHVQNQPEDNTNNQSDMGNSSGLMSLNNQVATQSLVTGDSAQVQQNSSIDFANQIAELRKTVQALQGQVEVQQHSIDQLQAQMGQLSSGSKLAVSPTTQTTQETPVSDKNTSEVDQSSNFDAVQSEDNQNNDDGGTRQDQFELYQNAFSLISAKQYDKAADALNNYLEKYPQGVYAANAYYWLGELALVDGDSEKAQTEFNTVLTQFAQSTKVPDSMLKLGMIDLQQEQWQDAKTEFKKIINQYPGSSSAQLAQQQLDKLAQSGY